MEGDHPCPYCRRTHRRLLFDTPKSAAGERIYPLVPEVAAALDRRRAVRNRERRLYGADYAEHGLVFAQPDGQPWRPDWISRRFKKLMRASGAAEVLPKVPPLKSTRSTMVSNLHEEGAPLEVTRDHYLSVTAERTRPEFEAVSQRLAPKRSDHPGSERRHPA